ncbi:MULTISPECIES: HesA/MoeB/ThiF family protein [unclassified Arsukibacterium]|uniref:HesA/MoeB/ThiF family protein n=1 Tax=unclassified Arsukibacterium TaxID=2635278 RepID=UPI000C8F8B07|nr:MULTISPECIES: molybdopterin-synthase adenylyltransferase MoeB [unclassified Arsukibacterium]MAA95318.1 molybdopterin-synthase adenylyltransferase MoeB [Rheinheimera sp.]HAW94252.1 molybdopterin-synthase adenylyltransferase MoeB [Candidatus Azambacteria bacterium]|tara:strand:- start:5104 stop:5868 length:765 start_codon:yes stop_codon:yes gene_type:complete
MTKPTNPSELSPQQAMRYSRQLMLPAIDFRGQEALLASSVLLVGMGGLGCAAAPYLVASGIGRITLVDDDIIDRSNLQRQILYREVDIGHSKVQQAAAGLRQLNAEIDIEALQQRLTAEDLAELIPQFSLVLDCSDNLVTRNAINAACVKAKVPLVSGAAIRFEGQVASFSMQGDTACYHCLSQLFGEQQLSCMEAGILSPVVGVIGTMQALEAVKILAEVGTPLYGKLQLFDALTSQWRQFGINKDPGCSVCG